MIKEIEISFFNRKEVELGLPEKEMWRPASVDLSCLEFAYPRMLDDGELSDDQTIIQFKSGADIIGKIPYKEVKKYLGI